MALAQHIRSLANCKYGPPASGLRKAVITCVVPTALYGMEAWYCGRRKPDPKASRPLEREVDARVGWHVDVVHRALTQAARAVLPVWKTTPTNTIFRDAGLPTAQAALDEALWRFSYRLHTVDEGHPLARRTEPSKIARGPGAGGTRPPRTKVQIAARLLPAIARVHDFAGHYLQLAARRIQHERCRPRVFPRIRPVFLLSHGGGRRY